MIFQRINRTNAERVFVVFKANEAGIAADDVCQLDTTAGSADGVNIIQPEAAGLNLTVGLADAAIADGAYGLVQVYGYRSTSRLHVRSSSLTAGHHLIPATAVDELLQLDDTGASAVNYHPGFATLESVAKTTSSTVSAKIFIRCM